LADCGWTRLAFLLFALTILLALAQLGSPSTEPRPLASKPPDRAAAEENPPAAAGDPRESAQSTHHEDASRTTLVDHDESSDHNGASADAPDGADPGPPVFFRPAPASPASGGKPQAVPVCRDLEGFPTDRRIAFPLPREYLDSYENTWGAPRPQGGHEGTDLMAPTGTAEYAVTDGTIVPVTGANENGWNSLGGYAVMLKAAYSVGPIKQGDLFYYAHLNHESALEIGTKVQVGQTVGYVGDTGQGPEVTRGLFPPHLHFGWYDATGARSTTTSGAMNPYPLLEWLKANGGAITGGSDARYCEALRTGGPVPSTGESRWLTPASPGVSPDLYIGSNGPGPVAQNPERQLDHASETAPAQQGGPAPNAAPRDAPERVSPTPQAPRDERTSGAEGIEDRSDAANPTPGDEPEDEESNDHPDKEQKAKKDEEEDQREAPEKAEPEDPQPPDDQTSPDEDQYAPETGGESDPE
jgi:murein DD-endopeptidase MepM/ murein hydrolase activator NlpD